MTRQEAEAPVQRPGWLVVEVTEVNEGGRSSETTIRNGDPRRTPLVAGDGRFAGESN